VFADIEEERYTIDPEDIKRHITPHTKGIILVHYAGMPCLMEEILALSKKYHLFIVEDAAHTMGAIYKGKALGTFGIAGAYSFHGTKNICCGEGGAVVTNDKALADRMEIYRANGTNRREFLRGTVDKYTWVGRGTSFFLSDILASILVAQMGKLDRITKKRVRIARKYTLGLENYQNLIVLPIVPPDTEPNWHIYAVRFKKEAHAVLFLESMHKRGIAVSTHYVPLHNSPMGIQSRHGGTTILPVTELVAKTLVRLPIYPGLTDRELTYILKEAQKILRSF
jgi:dTDP-4-amino-4,6-dideoxygalactose transaminase